MEVYKSRFVIVALLLSAFAIMETLQQDFNAARNKINQAKPDINYKTFCSVQPLPQGEDNIACRVKGVPSVGFLVCKSPTIKHDPCDDIINTQVKNIGILKNAKVKTAKVPSKDAIIRNVKCGIDPSEDCSGFLEGWIDKKVGLFQQIRDHISNDTVPAMITKVKKFTKKGLKTTAADLRIIKKFMEPGPGQTKYKQICDLQGFFLAKGGFLVGDAPQIAETSITGRCDTGEPTTKEVLSALDTMINAFKAQVKFFKRKNVIFYSI